MLAAKLPGFSRIWRERQLEHCFRRGLIRTSRISGSGPAMPLTTPFHSFKLPLAGKLNSCAPVNHKTLCIMKSIISSTLVTLCLIACNGTSALEMPCSENDVSAARTASEDLMSWEKVYIFFKNYHDCPDPSIYENVAESIQKLWIEQWPEIPQMVVYANQNNEFKYFIWQQISDDTFPQDDFDTLVNNAKNNCPRVAAEFCLAVAREARRNLLPSARRSESR